MMTRVALVLSVLLYTRVFAITCDGTALTEGQTCVMSDNVTQGTCTNGACVRTYTIPGNAARTGTGTITASGTTTVTGSGTVFTTELRVGDVLTANSQRRVITAIASDTSLTVSPRFKPALSGAAFTYTNPIVRWVDENGTAVAVLDSRGLMAFGQAWADGPLTVAGPAEPAVNADGKAVNITSGSGGPADSTFTAGLGGAVTVKAGKGGSSSLTTGRPGGDGGTIALTGGLGGTNSAAGGTGGLGGGINIIAGTGGLSSAGSGTGGPGNDVLIEGGDGGTGLTANGAPGRVLIQGGTGGVGFASVGDVLICNIGGIVKMGTQLQLQVDCSTGNITKINNVPVAGLWNVNAFQQANAGGM